MDDVLYKAMKQLQASAQLAIYALPTKDSPMMKALRVTPGDEWKLGALIDCLLWLEAKASGAATGIYMQGKE